MGSVGLEGVKQQELRLVTFGCGAENTVCLMGKCKELSHQVSIIRHSDYMPTKEDFDVRASRQQAVLDHISEATLLGSLTGEITIIIIIIIIIIIDFIIISIMRRIP
jgi:hypothetical protein